ncbi:uncharacterized protein [Choristoneura fumiferana]|uniref:uncharacterized protein n=1 Tax=Choristoneura fumiferana TaxID=7141 RepID=UPI003D15D4DE
MTDSESETTFIEPIHLKSLIKKRGTIKSKLTLFNKFLEKFNTEPLSGDDVLDLELRVARLTKELDEFEKVQDKIETVSSDVEAQMSEREAFENSYFQLLSKAKGLLRANAPSSNQPIPSRNTEPAQAVHEESIKFPEISLPSFSGDMTTWIEFRDTFDALINQSNLKPMQRFKYLRGCLRDGALEVISALDYSEEGYAIAWQLLCERFNNPRYLVNNHLRALLNVNMVYNTAPALRHLSDNISKHLRSLRSLQVSTEGWDVLLIFLLTPKLEKNIQRKWEEKITSRELPTLQDFKMFLRKQADILEAIGQAASEQPSHSASQPRKAMVITSPPLPKVKQFHTPRNQCPHCKGGHYINQCKDFLALNPPSRIRSAKQMGLCLNCLGSNHILPNCRASTCRTCKGKHHTLLHVVPITEVSNQSQSNHKNLETMTTTLTNNAQSVNLMTQQSATVNNACAVVQPKPIILSTAQIKVFDSQNNAHILRALLDSGSQSNFITQRAAEILNLQTQKIKFEVLGFNENMTTINQQAHVTIMSRDESYSTRLSCFVVPNICSVPNYSIPQNTFNIPQRFQLADEYFIKGGAIDLIIGAEHFYQLLCIGQHRLGDGLPILQRTRLGWVVSGPVDIKYAPQRVSCNFVLNNDMRGIWEANDLHPPNKVPDDDYINCEKAFDEHTRTSDGNFVVTLPLKEPTTALGDSRHIAFKRFKTLETKFARNTEFKEKYVKFMTEFKEAGHMVECIPTKSCNYVAHHAVVNPDKTTTPLRVVIDPSCQTTSGKSLNDIQYKGTVMQDDLIDILLRFRKYEYVVNADIEKMYRMIYIKPTQCHLQCILWRDHPSKPLLTYMLTTLSFGLKCAPHIATRCLQQLSYEIKHQFPDAAEAITNSFYMDDFIFGGDSERQVAETAVVVQRTLGSANFNLRKWNSNSSTILQALSRYTNQQTVYVPAITATPAILLATVVAGLHQPTSGASKMEKL